MSSLHNTKSLRNLRNGIPCSYTVALNSLSQGLPKTSKLWFQLKGTVENLNIERGVDFV